MPLQLVDATTCLPEPTVAVIYTLIGTAKLNGIDPEADLRHVLLPITDYSVNRIDDLLPWSVAPQLIMPESAISQ